MRAVAVNEYEGQARLGEFDTPSAGPGGALIRVQAAGMNPMDQSIASGDFKDVFPATFPLILGVDVAGIVEAVGEGPGPHSIGDRVFGQLLNPPIGSSGAYAEYAMIPANASVAAVPESVSSEVAATLPTPGVTALQLARSVEPLRARTIALIGAGGAVGSFLAQLLVAADARVLAIALPRQTGRVRSYGVEEVIDATTAPMDSIRRAAPNGVDVLIDLVSDADQFTLSTGTLASGGTVVSTRYAGDIEALAAKGIQGVNFVVHMTKTDLGSVAALIASEELLPPPIRTVRFEDVPRLLNAGGDGFDGKTVLQPEK